MEIIHLYDAIHTSKDLVGTKAYNLSKLYQQGFQVPPGFCITTNVLSSVLQGSLLGTAEDSSEIPFEDIIAEIERCNIPHQLEKQIISGYNALTDNGKVAVVCRSSAVNEDLDGASFAGQYETKLNIQNCEELFRAIRICWCSAFSQNVIEYMHKKGINPSFQISLLIQKMVISDSAGVLFTDSPIFTKDKHMLVQVTDGLGEAIVSGQSQGEAYSIRTQDGHATKLFDSASKNHSVSILNEEQLQKLWETGRKCKSIFNKEVDIEFCYGKESGYQTLYLLQCRPLSLYKSAISDGVAYQASENIIFTGIGASNGVYTGRCIRIETEKSTSHFENGDILVAASLTISLYPLMYRAGAIVVADSNLVSHACTVARELSIPCVINADISKISDNQTVTVDGTNGVVLKPVFKSDHKPVPSNAISVRYACNVYCEKSLNYLKERNIPTECYDISMYMRKQISLNGVENWTELENIVKGHTQYINKVMVNKVRVWNPNTNCLRLFVNKSMKLQKIVQVQIKQIFAHCPSVERIVIPLNSDSEDIINEYKDNTRVWFEIYDEKSCLGDILFRSYQSPQSISENSNYGILLCADPTEAQQMQEHLKLEEQNIILSDIYSLYKSGGA